MTALGNIPETRLFPKQDKAILQMLDEALDIACAIINQNLEFVYIGRQTYELLGLTPDDIKIGEHITQLHETLIEKGIFTAESLRGSQLQINTQTKSLETLSKAAEVMSIGNGHILNFKRIPLSNGYTALIAHDVT